MPWWLLVSTILGVLLFGHDMSDSSRLLAIETVFNHYFLRFIQVFT